MKRRHFLQTAAVTSLGLAASRYNHAIAQPSGTKRALLIGINDYNGSDRALNLNGCHTDAELQKNLLQYRYNFRPHNIHTLLDPDRDRLIAAFRQLIAETQPNDTVVIQFSGHGSKLHDPTSPSGVSTSLIPFVTNGDVTQQGDRQIVPDLSAASLFMLLACLPTENVTTILDCCYAGGGTRGSIRIRTVNDPRVFYPSDAEIALQEELRDRLGWDEDTLKQKRAAGAAKGIVLAATDSATAAYDVRYSGFYAGLFTYNLTQRLWQATASPERAIDDVRYTLQRDGQIPQLDLAPGSDANRRIYFIDRPNPSAEGVILAAGEGNTASVWLGGLVPESVQAEVGFEFDVVSPSDRRHYGKAILTERTGLSGVVRLDRPMTPSMGGLLLRETSRQIPDSLELAIGIDPSLEVVTVAFEPSRVRAVMFDTSMDDYVEAIDYRLVRLTPEVIAGFQFPAAEAVPGAIALVSPSGFEVVPESAGEANETIEAVAKRLILRFRALLAIKLIKTLLDASSTQLQVGVEVRAEGQQGVSVGRSIPTRGSEDGVRELPGRLAPLASGTRFCLQVRNDDPKPMYIVLLVVSAVYGAQVVYLAQESGDRLYSNIALKTGKVATLCGTAGETRSVLEFIVLASTLDLSVIGHSMESLLEERGADGLFRAIASVSRSGAGEEVIVNVKELAVFSVMVEIVGISNDSNMQDTFSSEVII
jgi:hypothetical protein